MENAKKLICYLELNGRKIETVDDLKAVFDVEYFISRRKKISIWLKKNCPELEEGLYFGKISDDEWIKLLANFLGCDELHQTWIAAKETPVKDEEKDVESAAGCNSPTKQMQETKIARTFKPVELCDFLDQECEEICITGMLAYCIHEIMLPKFPVILRTNPIVSIGNDQIRKDIICKCFSYLNSPETESKKLRQALSFLKPNGAVDDFDFFGWDYNSMSESLKAWIIIRKVSGIDAHWYLHRDIQHDLAKHLPQLFKYEVVSYEESRRSKSLLMRKKAYDNI